jgi:hypothetical protein
MRPRRFDANTGCRQTRTRRGCLASGSTGQAGDDLQNPPTDWKGLSIVFTQQPQGNLNKNLQDIVFY